MRRMKTEKSQNDAAGNPSAGTAAGEARSGPDPVSAGTCPEPGEGTPPSRAPLWASLAATVFGIGRLRPGPGTWGSAAAVALWAGVAYELPLWLRTAVCVALALLSALIGIPAATRVARTSGTKDPQCVVIDEVAGQLTALIAVPLAWKAFLAGFILFRAFDIIKPPPVRQLEKLPEGAGIVLDDVAAGFYAFVGMQLLLRFGLLK
jgi:phosphatidylglycerophosphatase A